MLLTIFHQKIVSAFLKKIDKRRAEFDYISISEGTFISASFDIIIKAMPRKESPGILNNENL